MSERFSTGCWMAVGWIDFAGEGASGNRNDLGRGTAVGFLRVAATLTQPWSASHPKPAVRERAFAIRVVGRKLRGVEAMDPDAAARLPGAEEAAEDDDPI